MGWIARHTTFAWRAGRRSPRSRWADERRPAISWMGRLKIAPNRAYCRVATGHGSRRGAADLLQNAIRSSEGGVAWRFQIPFRVAQLRRRARRDIPGARTGSNTGDDVCAWIGARMLTRSSSLRDFYEAYYSSGKEARVIQVGANDGIMCDPLRRFLVHRTNQNIRALLVEPILNITRNCGISMRTTQT